MLYRAADSIPSEVTLNVDPQYRMYQLLFKEENLLSWSPVGPSKQDLYDQEWYNPIKFMDPNEINLKMGYPPAYIVVKDPEPLALLNWIKDNFSNLEIIKDAPSDIIFEGKYNGSSMEPEVPENLS